MLSFTTVLGQILARVHENVGRDMGLGGGLHQVLTLILYHVAKMLKGAKPCIAMTFLFEVPIPIWEWSG